jgi:hypothetical protein
VDPVLTPPPTMQIKKKIKKKRKVVQGDYKYKKKNMSKFSCGPVKKVCEGRL